MVSNIFDYETCKSSDNFGIKKYKDSHYLGQLKERKRHGNGVLVSDNGRLYEGQWLNDKRTGRGYEEFPNGNIYEGMYLNNKAHGKGVYKWKNGELYDGEWR